MADKRSTNFSSRLAVEGPRKALAKGMENIERERRQSRKEYEKEKTILSVQLQSSIKSSNHSMTESMFSPEVSQSTFRLDNTDRSDINIPGRDQKERAALEVCEQMKVQFELTLAALLDIDHPLCMDKRLRPGPSKMGGTAQEKLGSTTTLRSYDGSGIPGPSTQKMASIEDRFAGILGNASKTAFSSGSSASAKPNASFQRSEKSETVSQPPSTIASTSFDVDPEMLQKNLFAKRLMSVVKAMADPTGPTAVSKNHKTLRNLLDECRLTVRSIKAGTDPSGRMQTRTTKKIADILPLIRPAHRADGMLSPEDALSCGYLRLSKEQVVRLEDQLRKRGIDPGIHRHTDISDLRLFEDKPTNANLKPMPFYLPATTLQVTGSHLTSATSKKATEKKSP